MTQENKELLLKVLCCYLVYGIKVCYKDNIYELKNIYKDGRTYLGSYNSIYGDWHCSLNDDIYPRPYLFPLSSMTQKQRAELSMLVDDVDDMFNSFLTEVEFYHRHHIDYKGLIEKGLAIDATGLNIY